MPRVARIVVPGVGHHVTQRGNNRQDVFFVDDDRRVYLGLLREQAQRNGLGLLGYCLMSNHVHLIAVPREEKSLAKAIGRTHLLYTQYLHRLHGRSGHLWQNRFYSCALDEAHCWAALCYVERNPVRARLVRKAWRYQWSSAAAHCGVGKGDGLLEMGVWRGAWRAQQWRERPSRPEDEEALSGVRASTHTGRPLGSDAFLSKVESLLGRRLRALPIGRPRKTGDEGK
jgi:REP-associated tyrosine transposase